MSTKIKGIIFIFLVSIFAVLTYYTFNKLSAATIKEFNRSMIKDEVETLTTAFSRRTESLSHANKDWSQWDDSYKFIQDLNDEYKQTNLNDETFQSANFNIILFFDREGFIIYKKAVSLEGMGETAIPAEIFNYTTNNNKISIQEIINTGEQKTGFLSTSLGTFLFAVSPISTSEGLGPFAGALMMGRYINDTDLEELKKSTGYDLDFFEHTSLGDRLHPNITHENLKNGDYIIDEGDSFSVYTLTKDSWGNNAQVINMQHKITGLEYGKKLAILLTAISTAFTCIFAWVVLAVFSNRKLEKSPIGS